MDGKLDISVRIAGRKYSMKGIDSKDEEVIRRAASMINERVALYQARKLVDDPIDYLAMAALQISIDNEKQKIDDSLPKLVDRLDSLDKKISDYMSEKE